VAVSRPAKAIRVPEKNRAPAFEITRASFAANVRLLREQRGLTQERAAEAAGVSYIYWKQLESERDVNPTLGILVGVALALDVEPMELLRTRAALAGRAPGRPKRPRVGGVSEPTGVASKRSR
jgi:DNA-binding XRE family transcriptional regulator